jgi:alkanesulfonate monooxygenase SsuD/methylene tetrahydromethanopterin reductase-like flavin-dependent oxidoreductase (luciferase family)
MMATHLCGVTKNLRIGCGFNIVPMWHPLRLAEDYAMADILTGGRVIFGVGRGYHTREVETFGSPLLDQNANRGAGGAPRSAGSDCCPRQLSPARRER